MSLQNSSDFSLIRKVMEQLRVRSHHLKTLLLPCLGMKFHTRIGCKARPYLEGGGKVVCGKGGNTWWAVGGGEGEGIRHGVEGGGSAQYAHIEKAP